MQSIFLSMIKYLCILPCCFVFAYQTVCAQNEKKQLALRKKTFKLTSVALGLDASNYVSRFFDKDKTQHALWLDVGFNRKFFVVAEAGISSTDRIGVFDTLRYRNKGNFIRAGLDLNLIAKSSRNDAITLGLRYARASFNHSVDYEGRSTYWGNFNGSISENALQGSWVEFITSVRVEPIKNICISTSLRFKLFRWLDAPQSIQIAEMPGYGTIFPPGLGGLSVVIISYHVLYRIPFE